MPTTTASTARPPTITAPRSSPCPPTLDAVPRGHLYTRLQHDWLRVCARRANVEQARTWTLPISGIASLDSLDEILRHAGYGRVDGCTEHHDDVLGALVAIAQHDTLAARVVLQRILPGLWRLARCRNGIDVDDVGRVREQDDEVLSTAWTVIRCFRLDHRRDHIAARMLKEIEYRTFRLPHRRHATFVPTSTEHLDQPIEQDPMTDSALVLDVVLQHANGRGLTEAELGILRSWGAGTPAADVAIALSVTERTVRNHRAAALRRVQQLVTADRAQNASRMMSSVSHAR